MIPLRLGKKPHKYKAKPPKETVDGNRFDSQAELSHYCSLKILQRAGQITELVIHPRYPIVINKQQVCIVELDFAYRDEMGLLRVDDVKGMDTPVSKLKRKLVEAAYGFQVNIVKRRRRS